MEIWWLQEIRATGSFNEWKVRVEDGVSGRCDFGGCGGDGGGTWASKLAPNPQVYLQILSDACCEGFRTT